MISRIYSSPSPSKYIHSSEEEKNSLQVKDLFNGDGTDHLKRLKIMDQLRKRLKRTIVNAEGL